MSRTPGDVQEFLQTNKKYSCSVFGPYLKAVFLVNRVSVPRQKVGISTKMGKTTSLHSTHQKPRALLLKPPKTTKIAGVTQARAGFTKSRVFLP